jgi:D-3-phosphoglycerate dehydrogenase
MIAQFTTVLGNAKLNIAGMVDQNKNDLAYAIIDVDGKVTDDTLATLTGIDGVIKVRPIFA